MAFVTVGADTGSANTADDNDVFLYYTDHGTGRPVVLIHGWPLSSQSWEAQEQTLVEAGYRVIAYDRRGFGRSSQPWNGYDYDTFADDLAALVDELGLTDLTLVGFSMGGGEVVRYLSRHGSDRVRSAVLAGAVPPFLLKTDDNPDGALDQAFIDDFHGKIRADRIAFLEGFLPVFFSAGDTLAASEAQVQHALRIASAASGKATHDCVTAWGTTDFRPDLAAVTMPTLVIHGDSDNIVPFEVSGKRSHAAIDGSTLVVIKGAPHPLNVSHADEFNAALLDFLAD
jgi:non-heme chloroperoxidase